MNDKIERRGDTMMVPSESPGLLHEFLAFVVGEETFAFPLASVREILKPPPITPVPRSPSEVAGVISVRGKVVTVVDLRQQFGVEAVSGKHTRILLTVIEEELMGMMVDRVLQVYRFAADEMELATAVGGDVSDYVLGVGRPGEKYLMGDLSEHDIVVLIDPSAFFTKNLRSQASYV